MSSSVATTSPAATSRPDLGRTREELAADPEAEIGLGAGADRPGEPMRWRGTVQPGRRHHDHLRGRRDRGGLGREPPWRRTSDRTSGSAAAAAAATPIPATTIAIVLRRRIYQPPGFVGFADNRPILTIVKFHQSQYIMRQRSGPIRALRA